MIRTYSLEIVAISGRSYNVSLFDLWYSSICTLNNGGLSLFLKYRDGREIDFRGIKKPSESEIRNIIREALNEI